MADDMSRMALIEYWARRNRWAARHPAEKVLGAMLGVGLAVAHPHPGAVLVVGCLACVAIRSAGVPLRVALGIQLLPLLFLLPFAATVALDGAVWQGSQAVPAFTGLLRAAESLLRAVVALLCTSSLVLTTSLSDLAWLLLRAGVPRVLVDALLVTHRFFLSLSAGLQTLTNAQRARGGFLGWSGRVRSAGAVGGALLGHTLDRALAVERGLFARGGVPIPRWSSEPWSRRVCAALVAVAAVVMLVPGSWW